jgi:CAAX prenyl protease-like protein
MGETLCVKSLWEHLRMEARVNTRDDKGLSIRLLRHPSSPYVLPFAIFALMIYAGHFLTVSKGLVYPATTIVVGLSLFYFRDTWREEIRFSMDWLALLCGVFVFVIWVLPDGFYPQIGQSQFNPYEYADGQGVYFVIGFRMIGAALVVPLMEELFWRSFALRFMISSHFKSVPLGHFSWFSFLIVSIAFGFEHHQWLPGILAGLVYAGVLYRSRNLFSPILSHSVTNLLLAIYVLFTGKWEFW